MKSKLDEDALTKKEVEELKDKIKIGYEFEWRIKAESLEDQTKTTWQRKKLRVSHKSRYLFLAKDRKGKEYSITYIELAIAVRKERERKNKRNAPCSRPAARNKKAGRKTIYFGNGSKKNRRERASSLGTRKSHE